MSALPPKADICGATRYVRFVPIAVIARLYSITVGAARQRKRDRDVEGLCSLEVNEHLYLGGLQNREIGRLLAGQNPARVNAGEMVEINNTASVTNPPASRHKVAPLVNRRHGVANGDGREICALAIEERIAGEDHEAAGSQLRQTCDSAVDFGLGAGLQDMELQPEGAGCATSIFMPPAPVAPLPRPGAVSSR